MMSGYTAKNDVNIDQLIKVVSARILHCELTLFLLL